MTSFAVGERISVDGIPGTKLKNINHGGRCLSTEWIWREDQVERKKRGCCYSWNWNEAVCWAGAKISAKWARDRF